MQGGTRRVVLFGLALGLALCVLFPDCAALPATGGSTPSASEELTHRDRREEHVPTRRELQNTAVIGGGAPVEGVRVKSLEVNETNIRWVRYDIEIRLSGTILSPPPLLLQRPGNKIISVLLSI